MFYLKKVQVSISIYIFRNFFGILSLFLRKVTYIVESIYVARIAADFLAIMFFMGSFNFVSGTPSISLGALNRTCGTATYFSTTVPR